MSLSSENMMKLMAYADGELEGAERTHVEMLLATDVDAVRFVEQIAGLGQRVEEGLDQRWGKAIASFDVADGLMALAGDHDREVATSKETKVPGVSSLAAAREKRGNGLKLGAGVAAALALAASIFVFTQHRTEETPMARGKAPGAQPSAGVVLATAADGTGVDVSPVESGESSVSVFYLPTANELSTSVVVWVDETGEKK